MSDDGQPRIESISAVTLFVADMARAVRFYEALGFDPLYGGSEASFTSFRFGDHYLNLALGDRSPSAPLWGRIVLYVSDVDGLHRHALDAGLEPQFAPRDAAWGERYFHLTDPDGHELSFARPLQRRE